MVNQLLIKSKKITFFIKQIILSIQINKCLNVSLVKDTLWLHTIKSANTKDTSTMSFHIVTIPQMSSMIEVAVHHFAQMKHHALDSLSDRASVNI